MNLILASSRTLANYLKTVEGVPADTSYVVEGKKDRSRFRIAYSEEWCECAVPRDGFTHIVSAKGLQRLRRFLLSIEDQPVTIGFDNGWVWVKEAIL